MQVRVLGSAGAEFPGFHPPAFLIDGSLLLDAGTIGAVLSEEEQWGVRTICVSHCHLDHVRGIPLLADNIIIKGMAHSVHVVGTKDILSAIRQHLMNNIIWPDFSIIPSTNNPVISYREIEQGIPFLTDGFTITAIPVSHSVPAVGYLVRKGDAALLYTGDTGPTEEIWRQAPNLSALIVEVSFPNQMHDMALLTGHLTPMLLGRELQKLSALPPLILVTHPKPQYYQQIFCELRDLQIPHLELLQDGTEYKI